MSWWVRAAVREKETSHPFTLRMFEFITGQEPTLLEASVVICSRGFEINPSIVMVITSSSVYPPDKPRDQLVEMQKETKK